jgi:hypothetical protein
MSNLLSRRGLAVAAILTLVAAALALALAARPQPAKAQAAPAHDTEVIPNLVFSTNASGEIHLGAGTGSDDLPGVGCNPAGPRTGSNIPGQLVTDFQGPETVLRVFHLNGTVLANRAVRVTCTVDFGEGTAPAGTAAVNRLRSYQRNP